MTVEQAHPHLESLFPPETYYAAHLNIIRLGREICQARRPRCEVCPIIKLCDYGRMTIVNGELEISRLKRRTSTPVLESPIIYYPHLP